MAGQELKKYRISVTTREPLHIGAAPNPLMEVAGAVVRIGDRLAVPGPSLKGAYRAALERILIDEVAGALASARPCIPATNTNLSAEEQALIRKGAYKGQNCGYPGKNPPQPICPACYLLGTMGLVGFVRVPYLFADGFPDEGYSIRFDRGLDSAVSSANREFQFVEPGTVFTGTLEVLLRDTIRGWELGRARPLASSNRRDRWLQEQPLAAEDLLSRYVERPLTDIKVIGGFRSKGFGGIELELQPIVL